MGREREREKRGFRRQDFVIQRVYRRALARYSEAHADHAVATGPHSAGRPKVYPAGGKLINEF